MQHITLFAILSLLASCSTAQNMKSDVSDDTTIHLTTTDKISDLEKRTDSSSDTTYVINFWATWCKPCVDEMPYFLAFAKKHQDHPTKLILVSLDFPDQAASKLIPYLQQNGITEEVWHMTNMDYNAWIDDVDPSWEGSIPATLVKRQGKRHFGERSFDSIAQLDRFVKQLD